VGRYDELVDQNRDEHRSPGVRPLSVWLVVVPLTCMLYLLSTGPAVALRNSGIISQATFISIYAPIGWLTRFAPFNRLLEWYLSLWT
jgi:hypothetical protein